MRSAAGGHGCGAVADVRRAARTKERPIARGPQAVPRGGKSREQCLCGLCPDPLPLAEGTRVRGLSGGEAASLVGLTGMSARGPRDRDETEIRWERG